MKEIKIAEWIYKNSKPTKKTPLTLRIPNHVSFPVKEKYLLIKIYRMESED